MAKQQSSNTIDYAIVTQVILLRPKTDTTDEGLFAFFKALQNSQKHIPCLVAVSTGENHSTAHRGFTHGILLHFERDPQEAKAHPKYQEMIAKANDLCEQVVTFELLETLVVPLPVSTPEPVPEPAAPSETRQRGRPRLPQSVKPSEPPARPAWKSRSAIQLDERLKKIVIDQLGVDESEVVPSASLVEDLNADSLDLVEYIMTIEEVFHLDIPDEDAERLTTVGEAQAYLQEKSVL